MYVAVGLWYGAGVALIGWRLTRHFGWRGQAAFISLMSVFGLGRDYAVAAVSGVIVFAPGIKTVVGDVVCWAILLGMAQGVMRLIAGPAKYDRLARTSR